MIPGGRRILLAISILNASSNAADDLTSLLMHSEESSTRDLEVQQLPSDITICDEYFFGRRSNGGSNNHQPFCVNGGFCKASWARDPEHPCECLSQYTGPHCEFNVGNVPTECQLGCRNNGHCKIGAPTWQHYYRETTDWKNPLDLQHCVCPEGYYGILCELKGKPCGDSHCHNGGSCVQANQPDGSIREYCDCTTAKNSEGTISYAGKYCEHESTTTCSSSNSENNGHQFCVNGGTCKSETHLGCYCKEGYVGPICEFEDRGQAPVECNLSCMNHGICRKGAKDVSVLEHFGLHHHRHLQKAYNEDFEHCVCPRGFVGLQCEYELDICPGGAHACLNGGDCVTVHDGQNLGYACDCSQAVTETSRFAGVSCEMESTEFCTIDGGIPLMGPGINSFCTNGGRCKKYVPYRETHPGCNCQGGFQGDNCQFLASDEEGQNVALIVAGTIACMSIFSVAVLFILRKRHRFTKLSDVDSPMPPTMDHIRTLGGRGAEFTEAPLSNKGNSTRSLTSASVRDTEELCFMRKAEWPNSKGNVGNPINLFNDIPLDKEEVRAARQKEWPNASQNDASNPIRIFDDISVSTTDSDDEYQSSPRLV